MIPTEQESLKFINSWLWDSTKYGDTRESESWSPEQILDMTKILIAFNMKRLQKLTEGK